MRWKDFLHFQRGSKLAVLLLLILIVLTMIFNAILSYRSSSDVIVTRNDSLVRAFEAFRRTWREREPSITAAGEKYEEVRVYSPESDPGNEPAGRGFPAEKSDIPTRGDRETYDQPYPVSEKLSAGEAISLNEADTARWKMIPGIGSTYASRVVKYRELLGGYVRMEQLLEVYGVDNELYSRVTPYIEPDSNCRKLQVNKAEFSELLRHPYLSYKQVQVIVNLRRRKGNINSLNELAMLEEFTSNDIFRLEPYLEF